MSRSARAVRSIADLEGWAAHSASCVTFAGPDPHYGIGLDRLLKGYGILCFDAAPAAALLAAEGIDLLAVDALSPDGKAAAAANSGVAERIEDSDAHARGGRSNRADDGAANRVDPRGTPALVRSPRALAWLRQRRRRAGDGLPLLVFKPSHRLEQTAQAEGWRLLCAPAALARRWENKVAFRALAEALGLQQPPGTVAERTAMDYDGLAAEFGPTLVVQAPHGYAGMQSHIVTSPFEMARALKSARSPQWRVTGLVRGTPLSVNACVTARGVAVGAPFLQLTGLAHLTPYPLGSCGQDWAIMGQLDVDRPAIIAAARTLGDALAADGFRGVFGVDFVQGVDGQVVAIEVNPRLIASIALCTQLELADGRLPLLARHLIAHLEPGADQAPLDSNEAPLCGGQVVLHHVGRTPLVVSDDVCTGAWPVPQRCTAAEWSGAAGPTRAAVRTEGLTADEALVLMPAPLRSLPRGAAHARLQLRGRGVAERGGDLAADIGALVAAVGVAVGVPARDTVGASAGDAPQ